MSEQWLYDIEIKDPKKLAEDLKKRKPRTKKKKELITCLDYLEMNSTRPKSKYEVPYIKGTHVY